MQNFSSDFLSFAKLWRFKPCSAFSVLFIYYHSVLRNLISQGRCVFFMKRFKSCCITILGDINSYCHGNWKLWDLFTDWYYLKPRNKPLCMRTCKCVLLIVMLKNHNSTKKLVFLNLYMNRNSFISVSILYTMIHLLFLMPCGRRIFCFDNVITIDNLLTRSVSIM